MDHKKASYYDAIDAAALDFIRLPVSKRMKGTSLQDINREQRSQLETYRILMDGMRKELDLGPSNMDDMMVEEMEEVFRKAELFELIMDSVQYSLEAFFGVMIYNFSFEEFCWRRDLLVKLMKQKGKSPAAAGGSSNTVRSRRGQFSAAPHCHCNNVGHQPGGSFNYPLHPYYKTLPGMTDASSGINNMTNSVNAGGQMMNLGGGPGGNDQVEVGRPNYGTNNSGGNGQMIGIQPYQVYRGGNNTNNVAGNGMGVGQFPSIGSGNIGGGGHGGNGMGAGHFPSIGNNIGGNNVDGTGNDISNTAGNGMGVGQFPSNANNIGGGSGDNANYIGGGHGGNGMGAGHFPSIGNNIGGTGVDRSWNGNGMGIGQFPSNGSNMGGSGVDGSGNTGGSHSGNGMVMAEFPSNVNNTGGSGVNGSWNGNGMGIGQFPSNGCHMGGRGVYGSENIGGSHGRNDMVIAEFTSNGNNMQGSGVDASGRIGGGHGVNGMVIAQFPSTDNNIGGSGVFGSDLRLSSALFAGSSNIWNDAELSDELLLAPLPEIDDFVN